MYFDDFLAQQVMKSDDPYTSHRDAGEQPVRRLLRSMWRGLREVAWGIDAFSSVWHGIDVPPEHGARSRPPEAHRHP